MVSVLVHQFPENLIHVRCKRSPRPLLRIIAPGWCSGGRKRGTRTTEDGTPSQWRDVSRLCASTAVRASVPYSTCLWRNDKPFDRLTIRTTSHECGLFNISKWGWPTATGTVPTLKTKKWQGRKNMLKSVGVGVLVTLSMLFANVNPLVSKVPSEWIIATPCPVKMPWDTTRFTCLGTMGPWAKLLTGNHHASTCCSLHFGLHTRDTETASHVTVWHEIVTNIWTFGNRALIQTPFGGHEASTDGWSTWDISF